MNLPRPCPASDAGPKSFYRPKYRAAKNIESVAAKPVQTTMVARSMRLRRECESDCMKNNIAIFLIEITPSGIQVGRDFTAASAAKT
jgi:hypothetical protein